MCQLGMTAVRTGVLNVALRAAAMGGIVGAGAMNAWAVDLLVPSEFATLQGAIDAAATGDVIRLAPGTYTGAVAIAGKAITIDGGGAATLDGQGTGTSVLTVTQSAGGTRSVVGVRGVEIRGGEGTTRDVPCSPFGPTLYGGGVLVLSSDVVLTDVTITNNRAALGGGVWYEAGSNVTLERCVLRENFASEIGAAVAGCWVGTPNSLVVRGSTFSFNTLLTSGSRYGILSPAAGTVNVSSSTFAENSDTLGVIHTGPQAPTQMVVSDSTFRDNRRLFGSVTVVQNVPGNSLVVERCTFQDEQGGAEGGRGGVLLIAGAEANGVVRDCTFRGVITYGIEAVLQGGGAFRVERCRMSEMIDGSLFIAALSDVEAVVEDVRATGGDEGMNFLVYDGSTLKIDRLSMIETVRNAITLTLTGGGVAEMSNVIAAESSRDGLEIRSFPSDDPTDPPDEVRLSNLTLTRNSIGFRAQGVDARTILTLTNSIVALNLATDLLPGLDSDVPITTYCIIDEGFAGAGVSVFAADPRFVNADERDYRLSPDSPAIDAGNSAAVIPGTTLDFNGSPRVVDAPNANTGVSASAGGAIVDIGATEFAVAPAGPVRCNPADIAYDDGAALPPVGVAGGVNNGVTEGDYNLFFATFFDAGIACDIADDQGTALPPFGVGGIAPAVNNGVTEGDYNLFFSIFFDGCSL